MNGEVVESMPQDVVRIQECVAIGIELPVQKVKEESCGAEQHRR